MAYQIDNASAAPYNAVVQVVVTYADGTELTGSGVVVGNNDVLTAAHLVVNQNLGDPVAVTVIPGRNGMGTAPFGSFTAKTINRFDVDPDGDGLLTAIDASQDLAVLGLVDAIGVSIGQFAMDENFLGGATFVTGYPSLVQNQTVIHDGSTMVEDTGIASLDVLKPVFNLDHEIHYGNSGGPVWYMDGDVPTVVGLVSTQNWGPRLGTNWETLQNWIAGNDWVMIAETIAGGDTAEVLTGSDNNDRILGKSGNDTIYGMAGLDVIYGNRGDDLIYGNLDDDTVYGGDGSEQLFGGRGMDLIYGNLKGDLVYGNMDQDTVFGGQGDDTVFGGQGDDLLQGNRDHDRLYGNLGQDTLSGGPGDDTLSGGPDFDQVVYNRESWLYRVELDRGNLVLTHAQDGKDVVMADVESLSFIDQSVSTGRLTQGIDDFGTGVEASETVAIDQPVAGSMDHDGDMDWFAVDLVAGREYEFFVAGLAPYPAAVLYDSQGQELAVSDVGDLFHTPDADGRYLIGVEDRSDTDLSLSFYELWVF